MTRLQRKKKRRRPEFAANGAFVAQHGGLCVHCGKRFLGGHPIRFVHGKTVHDGLCFTAAIAPQDDDQGVTVPP